MTNQPAMFATAYEKNAYNSQDIGKVVKITPTYIWIDQGFPGYKDIVKFKQTGDSLNGEIRWKLSGVKHARSIWLEFEPNPLEQFLSNGITKVVL